MRSSINAISWMGLAFGTTIGLAAIVLLILGMDEKSINVALQVTARLSFLLFWLSYIGNAMNVLFGPVFLPLRRYGRELGLAFASALFVHLGLVVWLCLINAVPATSLFIVFGPAVISTYSLVLLSIKPLQKAVGRKGWWLLRTMGLNYIAYAFAKDFLDNPFHGGIKHLIAYLPFAILAIAGPILCLAAFVLHIERVWTHPSYRIG